MSESAGKTRRAAEVAANVAGATGCGRGGGRRPEHPRAAFPGAYVEYSVDDQPGVVERARASQERPASRWPRAWPPRSCW
ncbi:MAG: hypothetical protein ACLUE1_00330 [Adlercreutzia equolifaciens]